MNSKKNSKCIVVSNKVLIFAVLKDKRINYIIKHLKIKVMNRIKFFGSVGMVMFIMWLCFWMFGGWYVKGSFETFSYIWLGVCVAVLVAVNCKLTKIHKEISK